jgi:hypothetical protein
MDFAKTNVAKPFQRGKTGIRTPEALWALTRFPSVPLQPLEHLSFVSECKFILFLSITGLLSIILNFFNTL